MMNETNTTMQIFRIHYQAEDGLQDYTIFRAEDEDHAEYKFRRFYPTETIIEIQTLGDA
jgi:hypothetical protein